MDEALQKLYWACREGSGFPGAIPDESSGRVSTEEILRGLGLSPPAMERSGPVTTQSESALDGGHPPSQRSYQPPDIQPKIVPRPSISIPSSNDTPQSMLQDDQMVDGVDGADGVDDVQGVDGVDGVSESEEGDKRRPSMLRRPQPDGDSAGQGQSFSENLDGSIDPAILPDGDVGMMDLQSPMHPPMNSTQFDVDDRRGSTQSRRGPSMRDGMQSNVFGASGQQGWGGQTQDVDGETLPWPGNMAAVYNDQKEPGGGGGFNTQNQQGWSDHDAQNRDFRS